MDAEVDSVVSLGYLSLPSERNKHIEGYHMENQGVSHQDQEDQQEFIMEVDGVPPQDQKD